MRHRVAGPPSPRHPAPSRATASPARWRACVPALLAALLLPLAARAAQGPVAQTPQGSAALVSDVDAVTPGRALHVGLLLRLAPGWHTYWTDPGDAGAPPTLDLSLPPGVTAGPIRWPAPEALPQGPLMSYGYTGAVLLPLELRPAPGGGPLRLQTHAAWLACATLCVPEEAELSLDLPAAPPAGPGTAPMAAPGTAPGTPSAEAPLFAAAAARTPVPDPSLRAAVAPDGVLTVSGPGLAGVRTARLFPDEAGTVRDAAPQPLRLRPDALELRLAPGPGFDAAAGLHGVLALDGDGGPRFVLLSAIPGGAAAPDAPANARAAGAAPALDAAADVPSTPMVSAAAAPLPPAPPALPQAVVLALLGGVLLNLMPCVFPVLAMKAMGLARLSGAARGAVRREAASFTAGVLLAFAGLGGVALALRAAGAEAGWGFQFQSPPFVAAVALVLFAVGLSLSGALPVGGRLAGAGQSLAGRGGHAGAFFTGLLAVLVATPCTAPFMGAATAAALAAPPAEAMLVFLALGLGLAAPYALLALLPGLARLLPRPGAWMGTLQGLLAFPMFAAAAWMLWVASLEAGPSAVAVLAGGAVLLGFGAWCWRLGRGAARRWPRRLGVGAAAVALGLAALSPLALAPGTGLAPGMEGAAVAGLGLAGPAGGTTLALLPAGASGAETAALAPPGTPEPFTLARLDALRAAGRPVFVNMTAAWCVTCLLNERLALSPGAVRAAFARHDVAYLKGDWTRQDPQVTAFLRAQNRDGVPLYVFYPPSQAAPTVLPQLLTEGEVLRLLGG